MKTVNCNWFKLTCYYNDLEKYEFSKAHMSYDKLEIRTKFFFFFLKISILYYYRLIWLYLIFKMIFLIFLKRSYIYQMWPSAV